MPTLHSLRRPALTVASLPSTKLAAPPRNDRSGRRSPLSRHLKAVGVAVAATMISALLGSAAEDGSAALPDSGDTAWMLTATAFVLMMTVPGLALFYGGMVRKKNVLATAMQSFSITCLVTILWMAIGYSLAFKNGGPLNPVIGGVSAAFLNGVTTLSLTGTIPETVFMTFQMTFAIIAPALITGAFADRMKFSAMLWFMGLWSILVYAPVAHWVWGGGWLDRLGVLDFAGGAVVHINAGVAGLVAALVLGKREGYGAANMAPHNLVYSLIGAALLWVGWFGFNGGSALAANGSAGMAIAVTQIATAAAALSWMVAEWKMRGKPSVLGVISGAVAGLVAITPASGYVDPAGALFIGLIAGVVCMLSAVMLKPRLGYDDSLDAFGVHGVGGILGAILTGVFARAAIYGGEGGLLDGHPGLVGIQIAGALATIAWSMIATFAILMALKHTIGLRVSKEVEIDGLDLSLHGEIIH